MKLVIHGIVLLLLSSPAWACKPSPGMILDKRPLMERLNDEPLVFIGVVLRADGATADFEVEHVLRGKVDGRVATIRYSGTSCGLYLVVKQRWLYAGSSHFGPSMHLAEPDQHGISLVRFDDSKLKLPTEWQTCQLDAECAVVTYGCFKTAVNQNYLKNIQEKALVFNDKSNESKCSAPETGGFSKPFCEHNKCGSWGLKQN